MSGARAIASGLLGIILLVAVFVTGLSERAVLAGRPDLALSLFGARGMAANAYLEPHGSEKSVPQAGGIARTAVHYSYTHSAAIRALGILADMQGNKPAATALINIAARWGWRDTSTQFWLLQEGVKNREYGDIFNRADSLLRRGYLGKELFAVFRIASFDPDLRAPFIDQLASQPGWRLSFFQQSLETPVEQLAGLVAVADGLRSSEAPLTREELNPLALALLKGGQGAAAYALWQKQYADAKPDAAKTLLPWPSSDAQNAIGPFDWRIAEAFVVNAQVDAGDATNRLTVSTDASSAGLVADRHLALAPGTYGFVADGPHDSEARFWRWTVSCFGGGEVWRSAAGKPATFTIPANCPVQRVALSINGLQDMVQAQTWFGPARIERQ